MAVNDEKTELLPELPEIWLATGAAPAPTVTV
jgi:hypothetical protein